MHEHVCICLIQDSTHETCQHTSFTSACASSTLVFCGHSCQLPEQSGMQCVVEGLSPSVPWAQLLMMEPLAFLEHEKEPSSVPSQLCLPGTWLCLGPWMIAGSSSGPHEGRAWRPAWAPLVWWPTCSCWRGQGAAAAARGRCLPAHGCAWRTAIGPQQLRMLLQRSRNGAACMCTHGPHMAGGCLGLAGTALASHNLQTTRI